MYQRRRARGVGGRTTAPRQVIGAVATEEPRGPRDPVETARYIAQLVGEMTRLAVDARLDLLAYLLSMAQSEASGRARRAEPDADD